MNNEITVEHSAVVIEYSQHHNKWEFTVNGRDYSLDSLRAAREKIDEVIKALELKQRKNFEPVPAFNYAGKPGRITSIVGLSKSWRHSHNGVDILEVRFKLDSKEDGATKEEITSLVRDTPRNREIFAEMKQIDERRRELSDELAHCTNDDIPQAGE